MQRIAALVLVLLVGLVGYQLFHLDGATITVLIIVLAVIIFGLNMLRKRYGMKHLFGGMVNGILSVYDPTLPPLPQQDPAYPSAPYADGYAGVGYSEPTPQPAQVQEEPYKVRGPEIGGALAPGTPGRQVPPVAPVTPNYAPLAPISPYELHLGPNAYIDVQQAYVNTLLLDPQGNLTRVMTEELASKGVPLLFVDIAGTFESLLAEFPLGWRICSPASLAEGEIDPRAIPLNQESPQEQAQNVGHAILQEGWQVLFQFSRYPNPIDAIVTLWEIVNGITSWERAQQRRSGRLLPLVIIVTDAYRFCPDANMHSVFREIPDVAQAVRAQVLKAIMDQGAHGVYWYLATRKITGMEPQILKQCQLWMLQDPPIQEAQTGWITAYTGVSPQELQQIPKDRALIVDSTRVSQVVAFRPSRSSHGDLEGKTYTLPTLPALQATQERTPPFSNR